MRKLKINTILLVIFFVFFGKNTFADGGTPGFDFRVSYNNTGLNFTGKSDLQRLDFTQRPSSNHSEYDSLICLRNNSKFAITVVIDGPGWSVWHKKNTSRTSAYICLSPREVLYIDYNSVGGKLSYVYHRATKAEINLELTNRKRRLDSQFLDFLDTRDNAFSQKKYFAYQNRLSDHHIKIIAIPGINKKDVFEHGRDGFDSIVYNLFGKPKYEIGIYDVFEKDSVNIVVKKYWGAFSHISDGFLVSDGNGYNEKLNMEEYEAVYMPLNLSIVKTDSKVLDTNEINMLVNSGNMYISYNFDARTIKMEKQKMAAIKKAWTQKYGVIRSWKSKIYTMTASAQVHMFKDRNKFVQDHCANLVGSSVISWHEIASKKSNGELRLKYETGVKNLKNPDSYSYRYAEDNHGNQFIYPYFEDIYIIDKDQKIVNVLKNGCVYKIDGKIDLQKNTQNKDIDTYYSSEGRTFIQSTKTIKFTKIADAE